MVDRWSHDPRYAHGYFVPMYALAPLWMWRDRRGEVPPSPSTWGLAVLGLGAVVQLVGGYYGIESIEGLALLPDLAGIALLLGGWRILRWAWPCGPAVAVRPSQSWSGWPVPTRLDASEHFLLAQLYLEQRPEEKERRYQFGRKKLGSSPGAVAELDA
jgi:hypothetical protein